MFAEVDGNQKISDVVDGVYKPNTKLIAEDLVKAFNDGRVVYSRFGK